MLALPDFSQPFHIETDASGFGVGAVLQQNGNPLAFISKALGQRNQGLSTYRRSISLLLWPSISGAIICCRMNSSSTRIRKASYTSMSSDCTPYGSSGYSLSFWVFATKYSIAVELRTAWPMLCRVAVTPKNSWSFPLHRTLGFPSWLIGIQRTRQHPSLVIFGP